MLSLSVLAALVLGWFFGGRLSRFEHARLRLLFLPVLALLLQRLSVFPATLVLSYILLFLFVFLNRHLKKTALLVGCGSLCNLAVIAANDWRMPVAAWAVEVLSPQGAQDLLTGNIPMYALADPETKLLFLGDVLYCPVPVIGGFASIGDLFLMLGVFFCLLAAMSPNRLPAWAKSG